MHEHAFVYLWRAPLPTAGAEAAAEEPPAPSLGQKATRQERDWSWCFKWTQLPALQPRWPRLAFKSRGAGPLREEHADVPTEHAAASMSSDTIQAAPAARSKLPLTFLTTICFEVT